MESEPFSLQNNLLTPTQKLKRMEARERYQAIIEELYAKLEQKRALEGAKAQTAAVARL
jgi:long-chain acyl-CoA synthetase